jgi:hypothetical protein
MSFPYVVKTGDNLSLIASRFGLQSWRDIYEHPDNAAFRSKRPNPNVILVGDTVFIPSKSSPAPAPGPQPTPPGPLPQPPQPSGSLEDRLKSYLAREAQRNIVDVVLSHPAQIVVFGEIHFTADALKAFFLAELARQIRLRRPSITHFHASERFPATAITRREISDFFQAAPEKMGPKVLGLSRDLMTFLPLLAQANSYPGRRYAVLPIDNAPGKGEDVRHEALFAGFTESALLCPDVPRASIAPAISRGNMLLGARHAAKRHVAGRPAATTTERLAKAGWTVHAVRLTVRDPGGGPREDFDLKPRVQSAIAKIDGLSILEAVAGGRSFYADLTKPDSPFREVREHGNDAADIAYNQLFDGVLHLSASTVPFPVARLRPGA